MNNEKSDLIKSLMAKGDAKQDRSIVLGTHSGEFHADDVLASAVLVHELYPMGYNVRIIRSRNMSYLNDNCDIIYDVGHGKYDHHDDDKVLYPNGIKMAACGKILNDVFSDMYILEGLRTRLFYAVEAADNGQELPDSVEPSKLAFVSAFNPTWGEARDNRAFYTNFMKALSIVGNIYERILNMVIWDMRAKDYIGTEHTKFLLDNRFVEIDKYCPTFEYARLHQEFLGAIYPNEGQWTVRLAPSFRRKYETRCSFRREWRGLYSPNHIDPQKDLRRICPFKSARFCHPAGFLMILDDLEDAKAACEMLANDFDNGVN